MLVGGAAVQWLRDGLGVIVVGGGERAARGEAESTDGVTFVPALTGLGSPHWDAGRARADRRDHRAARRAAHIVRAALEGIAHQVADVLEVLPPASTCCAPTAARAATRS